MTRERTGSRGDAPTGPRRPEMIEADEHRRNVESLDQAADYQANPKADRPNRARATETGTAERAQDAAGLEHEEQHSESAERAYRASRGERTPREPRGRS